ncbi:beta-RFAP synthase [Rivibacter subsaxonicus]|uniref:Beta-RFAP synthase n=1 Tax=Rivibacter subsaxonicus TaxID=457575 RepID=A0A4Q7W2A2_9BURK|nr:beta-RFAP synthase [Rivibacter subsaxonicus]
MRNADCYSICIRLARIPAFNVPAIHSSPPTPIEPGREARSIEVRAPARLHLGFLDPGATLGRRFGSLGVVIDGPQTVVRLSWVDAAEDEVVATCLGATHELDRARAHLQRLRERLPLLRGRGAAAVPGGAHSALRLELAEALPAHAGLGSGTQLGLAIGRAYAELGGTGTSTADLARLLGRGSRSGVGIAGFDHGGLLLDGGPGPDGRPAPLISRIALPPFWRVLLVMDERIQGLSGPAEQQAIAALPPFPAAKAAEVCHEVLMRVLPGAADADFRAFANGITHVQQLLGGHFAAAQGGTAYTSPAVGRLLGWIENEAPALIDLPAAVGQSSWGPTGFAFVPNSGAADALLNAAREAGVLDPALRVSVVRTRSQGALVGLPNPAPRALHTA